MAHRLFKLKLPLVSIVVVLLTSCSKVGIVPVSLTVAGDKVINSSESESSLPVRLRLYQLSDLTKFQDATFRELWKMDKQTLAESYISSQEFTVAPDSKAKLKFDRQEKANYIGVVALFRHPELGKWRASQKISSQAASLISSMSVTVNGNSVRIK